MRALHLCRLLCACILAGLAMQARADDELQRLRQQNAELQARIRSLERACPSAAAATPIPAPAGAAVPSPSAAAAMPSAPSNAAVTSAPSVTPPPPPGFAPSATSSAAASQAPASAPEPLAAMPAAPAAPAAPPSFQAPPGYKLVKVDPEATATDQENCSTGVFRNTKDAPWKHPEAWQALAKQMQPPEVESVLGQHHTQVAKGARTLWGYGVCGNSQPQAYVVFDGKDLLYWQQPDF